MSNGLHTLKMEEGRVDVNLGSEFLGSIRGTDSLEIWPRGSDYRERVESIARGAERLAEIYITKLESRTLTAKEALEYYRANAPGALTGAGVALVVICGAMLGGGWLIDFAARHVFGAY
jgi:hypothetical protein